MDADKSTGIADSLRRHGPAYITTSFLGRFVEAGDGAEITFDNGVKMLDFASGNFGYGISAVRDAVMEQIKKLPLSNRVLVSRNLANLVARLNRLCPDPLSVSYVCNSGEEAFDGALKLSKGLHPDRSGIVVVAGSRPGTLSYGTYCAGIGRHYLDALSLHVVEVAADDVSALERAVDDNTLAVVYEPVLTARGTRRLAPDYIRAIRDSCDRTGSLMLTYEVKTGLGITGHRLASEFTNVVPDIVVLGGALSGGQVPIGAYVTRKDVNDAVYGRKNPSLHGSTTGGNPASCVAACAALDYIREEKLDERHRRFEEILKVRLANVVKLSSGLIATNAQIAGSLVAIKMSTPLAADALWSLCIDAGLLLQRPDHEWLYFHPPLATSIDELDIALERFSNAVQVLANDRMPGVG